MRKPAAEARFLPEDTVLAASLCTRSSAARSALLSLIIVVEAIEILPERADVVLAFSGDL
jgi:hypothetical protein